MAPRKPASWTVGSAPNSDDLYVELDGSLLSNASGQALAADILSHAWDISRESAHAQVEKLHRQQKAKRKPEIGESKRIAVSGRRRKR